MKEPTSIKNRSSYLKLFDYVFYIILCTWSSQLKFVLRQIFICCLTLTKAVKLFNMSHLDIEEKLLKLSLYKDSQNELKYQKIVQEGFKLKFHLINCMLTLFTLFGLCSNGGGERMGALAPFLQNLLH